MSGAPFTFDGRGSIILRGTVGSTAHGLSLEGTDDRDEMGIAVESFEESVCLGDPFEHYIYRTATERTGKNDARSMPGDLDLTIYSLRKYLRLALGGNPSVLIPLYLPQELLIDRTLEGSELQALAPKIVSKRALRAFYHYLRAQKEKLLGERGTRVHRPELVEKYGFDTKFAMHALRLGAQGCELATEGRLTLPMGKVQREFLLAVRTGNVTLEEIINLVTVQEDTLLKMQDSSFCVLPEEPDTRAVEYWMREVYWDLWRDERGGILG